MHFTKSTKKRTKTTKNVRVHFQMKEKKIYLKVYFTLKQTRDKVAKS